MRGAFLSSASPNGLSALATPPHQNGVPHLTNYKQSFSLFAAAGIPLPVLYYTHLEYNKRVRLYRMYLEYLDKLQELVPPSKQGQRSYTYIYIYTCPQTRICRGTP